MSATTTEVWMSRANRWVAGGALSWVAGVLAAVPTLVGTWLALTLTSEPGLPMDDAHVLPLGWSLAVTGPLIWLCLMRQSWARWVAALTSSGLILAGIWATTLPLQTDQPSLAFYVGLIMALTGMWGLLMSLRRARWNGQWLVVAVLGLAWLYAYLTVIGSRRGTVFMLDLLSTESPWWHAATLALGFAMAALMAERAGLWGLYAKRADLHMVGFISITLVASVVTCIAMSLLVGLLPVSMTPC